MLFDHFAAPSSLRSSWSKGVEYWQWCVGRADGLLGRADRVEGWVGHWQRGRKGENAACSSSLTVDSVTLALRLYRS